MSLAIDMIGIVSIIVQLGAAYFSFLFYRLNEKRLSGDFLLITLALLIMGFRRVTALFIETGILQKILLWLGYGSIALESIRPLQLIDRFVLPLAISIFLFFGFWGLLRDLKNVKLRDLWSIGKSRKRRKK